MKKGLAIGFLLLLNILTACHKDAMGGGGNVYSGPNEPSVFTSSPIDVANIRFTLSLGWIQPSGHTIPSDHVYFWYNNPNSNIYLPVYALASGKVTKILNVPVNGIPECKVWFQLNQKFTYYLDHVVLDTSIKEGVKWVRKSCTLWLGNDFLRKAFSVFHRAPALTNICIG